MMANEKLTKEGIEYIIGRLLKNAQETVGEWEKDKSNLFYDGKALAYYEMLDIIKAELDIREQDLKEFGLDVSLEEKLLAYCKHNIKKSTCKGCFFHAERKYNGRIYPNIPYSSNSQKSNGCGRI